MTRLTHMRHAARRLALRDPHVPENRRSELEDVPDVLSEGRRLDPFSPRHVRHFAESDLLDFVGELLPFRLIGRAHPVGDELIELRDVRPPCLLGAAPVDFRAIWLRSRPYSYAGRLRAALFGESLRSRR